MRAKPQAAVEERLSLMPANTRTKRNRRSEMFTSRTACGLAIPHRERPIIRSRPAATAAPDTAPLLFAIPVEIKCDFSLTGKGVGKWETDQGPAVHLTREFPSQRSRLRNLRRNRRLPPGAPQNAEAPKIPLTHTGRGVSIRFKINNLNLVRPSGCAG